MSTIKGRLEYRTILDFSKGRVSKNRIRQALRQAEVLEITQSKNGITFVENNIVIGMYRIHIIPFSVSTESRQRLKDYGGFNIRITEKTRDEKSIHLSNDRRFRNQYWLNNASNYQLRIKHLVDIIFYCGRLDRLRLYL